MGGLYRSQKNRIIGGVAGGLGEYFGVDVVMVRLLWVLAIFLGGGGLLVYIIAWIIIPDERKALAGLPGRFARQSTGMAEQNTAGDEEGKNAGNGQEEAGNGDAAQTTGAGRGQATWHDPGTQRRRNAGLILIGLGIVFLAYQLFGPLFRFTWPILLVILGFYLLVRERREGGQ
ncbi:MAG: PspC domain-containing protein [Bacillota bacterium]